MKKLPLLCVIALFVISRVYVFLNPPPYYSDVTADYERYANIWRYGLTPYLEHLYEYPPASIPLLSLPLSLDQAGFGKYYANYRLQILLIDSVFFIVLLRYLSKQKTKYAVFRLLGYIVLTTIAKDFLYEGLDLAFSASYVACIIFLSKQKDSSLRQTFSAWTLFWLSTAIKFLTLPLLVPLFFATIWEKQAITRVSVARTTIIALCSFLLVWGIPLALFRSSLSVSFVYNFSRPIKYASFPAHIIRWINAFTNSESQSMVAPDFPYVGPVSQQVTKSVAIVFPFAVFCFLIWSTVLYFRQTTYSYKSKQTYLIATYGMYIFLLFITAKTFSQPFHIWYLVLLPLLIFRHMRESTLVVLSMLLLVLLDTTAVLAIKTNFKLFSIIPLDLLRDSLRFIPMFGCIWYFFRYHETHAES
ncbi:MAG: hypothetical protein UY10_C0019G0006 [Microgenomates group bacterium GW2011_GWA2_47_8]|nr:MAG: hypothetical protein UY10_C0019G0006 [Microgenomates group bacterium GW2011_GWA2_47_8]